MSVMRWTAVAERRKPNDLRGLIHDYPLFLSWMVASSAVTTLVAILEATRP